MDRDYQYGFMLYDELLFVIPIDGCYELAANARGIEGAWMWTTNNPSLLVQMYHKPEHFMGAIPTHPKATFGNADPVVITTYRDGGTLHREYRNAIIPKLLPEGEVVDRTTLGSENTRRNIYTYRCPPICVGAMYASPMGSKVGGTYFMTECGESEVLAYLCHISKDDCLLLCLDKGEVAEALVHGYIPNAKGAGLMTDTEYLQSIPGMVASIKEGMATPMEDCDSKLGW